MSNKNSTSEKRVFEISKSQLLVPDFMKAAYVVIVTKDKRIVLQHAPHEKFELPHGFLFKHEYDLSDEEENTAFRVAAQRIVQETGVSVEFSELELWRIERDAPEMRTDVFLLQDKEIPRDSALIALNVVSLLTREDISIRSKNLIRQLFPIVDNALS